MAKPTQKTFVTSQNDGPVECLGMTFPSDQARREYYLGKLKEKLKDPAFRKIEGFPIGEDEQILELSNPPYYTACPNPFLADSIANLGQSQPSGSYHRDPFAVDVSEGRTDAIYTAHPYHTKVPPRAIARYIFHFTEPGDIVLDAFSGSGMTGVACGLCTDEQFARESGGVAGERTAILCDLSPAATFVSSVYLFPPEPTAFEHASETLLSSTDTAIGPEWMLLNSDLETMVDFQVWAEEFTCPLCQKPVISERVVDPTKDIGTAKEFQCPHCGGLVSKAPSKGSNSSKLERRLKTRFDKDLGVPIKFLPRAPIFAQLKRKKDKLRVDTTTDQRSKLTSLELASDYWYPTAELIKGERYELKDYCHAYGITHIHHFYLPRQLRTYSFMWQLARSCENYRLKMALIFFVQSNCLGMTIMNRYSPTHFSQVSQNFTGTLYVPSAVAETSHRYSYEGKKGRLVKAFGVLHDQQIEHAITTQSSSDLRALPDSCVDYVFVDPPFGRNLQYSELNQIWESWLQVKTNRDPEAVMDATRERELLQYSSLMSASFSEMYRVLKPNHWVTVVFHNSSNAVWFAIQEALFHAGFVVADVRTLNRESDTYKQIRQGLVKQDLVISCYKPSREFEEKVQLSSGSEQGVWDFVQEHLRQLPVIDVQDGKLLVISERQFYLLFDRMVAFHVQRGLSVPLSSSEFRAGLLQRFPERDGMFFLSEQATEFDRRRLNSGGVLQLELFVSDERTAIQWVRSILNESHLSYQDLQPLFMREAQRVWDKHEQPLELQTILDQNFIKNVDGTWRVPDPKKEVDLEQLRVRALLKEFQQYLDSRGRLKVVRAEALRAGFKDCWQKGDYETIIQMAKRVPEAVVQEDPALLMYYDNSLMRKGE